MAFEEDRKGIFMDPTISCIIPCRNASSSILTTLQALQTSSFPLSEVLCVDDASTDDTCEKIRRFARDSSLRISCLSASSVQRGAAACRNSGVQVATGDYLLFLDADVVVEQHTIAALLSRLSSHYTAMVAFYHDYSLRPGAFAHFQAYMVNAIYAKLEVDDCPCLGTQCVLMSRRDFLDSGGFDERYKAATVEDFELGYRFRTKGKRIGIAPDAFITHNHAYTIKTFVRNYYTKARDLAVLLLTRPYVNLASTGYHTPSNIGIPLLLVLELFCICAGLLSAPWLFGICCGLVAIHLLAWYPFLHRVAQRWSWRTAMLFLLLRTGVILVGVAGVAVAWLQVMWQHMVWGVSRAKRKQAFWPGK